MKKKPTSSPENKVRKSRSDVVIGDLRERFVQVLRDIFASNQSNMANELGISQTYVSKIALGKRLPGKQIEETLASHRRINPQWIRTGTGEPYLAEKNVSRENGCPIPVAMCLLPGPPMSNRHLLSDQVELITGASNRSTLYAILVRESDGSFACGREYMRAGDLLFIDSNPVLWNKNVLSLNDRHCVISADLNGQDTLSIHRLRVRETGEQSRNLHCNSTRKVAYSCIETKRWQHEAENRDFWRRWRCSWQRNRVSYSHSGCARRADPTCASLLISAKYVSISEGLVSM